MAWLALVLLLLAVVALPLVSIKATQEREAVTEREMDTLVRACVAFYRDTHELPQRLRDLVVRPTGAAGERWAGPYTGTEATAPGALPDCLVDAWDQPYEIIPGVDSSLTIYSAGPDPDDLEDDIVRWFSVWSQRQEETLDRLGTVNAAIDRYLRLHPDRPFAAGVPALIATLRADRFLGSDASLEQDGWGEEWIGDPPDQSPILRLTSRHLRRGPPVRGG
jgi:hypothetical protein